MSVKLESITKIINGIRIIEDINLIVNDGECLAILGPSGCGKSSTLRLIAGLDKPTKGKIYIDNKDVTNISPVDREIGMVFQNYALFPHLTVYSNLSLGLKIRGVSEKDQKARVNSLLSIMQLDHLALRLPGQLSGGQRQRVALARALLRDPSTYLLDEPMSNLDAQLREDLRVELRKLILNKNKPVIYVTHDQHEAMAMADQIAIMKNGKIIQKGSPKQIYEMPNNLFVAGFVGRPKINIFDYDSKYLIGVRPEDIKIKEKGIECELISKEWLGNEQLVFLKSKIGLIKIKCPANTFIDQKLSVDWSKDEEYHFDIKTGLRL